MNIRYCFSVLALVALSQVSCQKPTDFRYLVPTGPQVNFNYKVKEQIGTSELDMLWVIDNSISMGSHQRNVEFNLDRFIDTLTTGTSLHWKAGLISTTLNERPYIGFDAGDELSYSSPDPKKRLKAAVRRLGLDGDTVERMFSPIDNVLKSYPDFVRPRALLAIIIITDAPEQSAMKASEFIDMLRQVKGDLNSVLFYGILNPVDWCIPTDDRWYWSGSKFEEVNKAIKGNVYQLCDPKFGDNLIKIGENLASQVTSPKLFLKNRPLVSTLNVVYDSKSVPAGPKENGGFWYYDYDLNAIVFHDLSFAPSDTAEVQVAYEADNGVRTH